MLFVIGYLLVALLFLAVGLCLLISPGSYFALLDRMAQVGLGETRPSWDPTAPRWRAAGLALTLFALFMIVGPPLSVYLRSPEEYNQRLHSSHHSVSWGAVVVLLFFVALGVGFLSRPLVVLDRLSPRKLSAEPDVRRHAYKLRIFGGVLLVVALMGVCVQLLRYLRH
jgi:NADH:ubiquinone oxidoreductase subunit 5 (subunit L)/multisubunit Na+/H+ antiporter MnhA subunit